MPIIRASILFCLILSIFGCTYAGDRPPAVAGQYYPGNINDLTKAVDGFLKKAPQQEIKGDVVGIIAPHAGYVYSGQTAAYAFNLLNDSGINTVVLIGNSHKYHLSKGAVNTETNFKTPLGIVPIHRKLASRILDKTQYLEKNDKPHKPEHSLEVELPFLQKVLKDFKIVPILLSGGLSLEKCKDIGQAIAEAVKELKLQGKTVIVISTDMSHYPTWSNANMVDAKALKSLEKFDPQALKKTVSELMALKLPNESCVFCGEEAVYTGMYASKALGAQRAEILNYSNSGDILNDKSRVVGYGAAAFIKSKTNKSLKKSEGANMDDFKISEKSQKELLKIARESIDNFLDTGHINKIKYTDPELTNPSAVFVTLTKNGRLRGCIGTTAPQAALCHAVNQMAISAAFEDHRFPRVSKAEMDDIHVEISILSPMRRVKSADEVIPNKHGVVVKSGLMRGGLFLPQVWDHFNSKEDFLGELCQQKAGLRRDAWKDPETELYVFTVFAFEE